tara:strand:+ start:2067 stop:2423 length:357 start_codon:yes stop_codon:yes gene_type:complete
MEVIFIGWCSWMANAITWHHAETRQLATHNGLEHELGMTLKAVISDEMGLRVPQMLQLAEVLTPPGLPLMRPPEELNPRQVSFLDLDQSFDDQRNEASPRSNRFEVGCCALGNTSLCI